MEAYLGVNEWCRVPKRRWLHTGKAAVTPASGRGIHTPRTDVRQQRPEVATDIHATLSSLLGFAVICVRGEKQPAKRMRNIFVRDTGGLISTLSYRHTLRSNNVV